MQNKIPSYGNSALVQAKKDDLKIINLYSGGRPPRRNWDVFPSAPQINSSQNRLLMGYYSSSASFCEDDCSQCSTDG